jgi:uncharacterized membrane protein
MRDYSDGYDQEEDNNGSTIGTIFSIIIFIAIIILVVWLIKSNPKGSSGCHAVRDIVGEDIHNECD